VLFIASGTETVCAPALLCGCGFWGSRGCCGNEDSPARDKSVELHVELFGRYPRSWILERLEANANRLKMAAEQTRPVKESLAIKRAVQGV